MGRRLNNLPSPTGWARSADNSRVGVGHGGRAHLSAATAGHRSGALADRERRTSLRPVWLWWTTVRKDSTTPTLESSIQIVRLQRNLGPAGGFGAGMEVAFSQSRPFAGPTCARTTSGSSLCRARGWRTSWAGPRHAVDSPVRPSVRWWPTGVDSSVGVPTRSTSSLAPGSGHELMPVDVAGWGATLLARSVFDAGIVPDADWFFGLEDFDFFCRVRRGGFDVLLDSASARAVADEQTSAGRTEALRAHRPVDQHEAWRGVLPRPQLVLAGPALRPSVVACLAPGLLGPASAKSGRNNRAPGYRPGPMGRCSGALRRESRPMGGRSASSPTGMKSPTRHCVDLSRSVQVGSS